MKLFKNIFSFSESMLNKFDSVLFIIKLSVIYKPNSVCAEFEVYLRLALNVNVKGKSLL